MKIKSFNIASLISILLIILSVFLLIINPKKENNLTKGYNTPIIAFEFIDFPAAVQFFFEVKNPTEYKNSMLLGNKVDYLFMLVYSTFLFFVAKGLYSIFRLKILYLAMTFCVLMLLGDAFENFQIYNIIQNYKTTNIQQNLDWLHIFTWLKWSSIASTFLIFAPFIWKLNNFGKVISIVEIACFCLAIIAFFMNGMWHEIFALSVSVTFLLLTLFVFLFKTDSAIQYNV